MLKSKENGSITVEAALVLPLFILFIVFLASMIKLAIYDVAIDRAVSESTKQVATHLYPVAVVNDWVKTTKVGEQTQTYIDKYQRTEDSVNQQIDRYNSYKDQIESITSEIPFIPPLAEINEFSGKGLLEEASAPLFSPIVRHFLDINISNEKDFKVTGVTFPNLENINSDPYFSLEVEYTLDLPFPFMSKNVVISKQASERVWLGN